MLVKQKLDQEEEQSAKLKQLAAEEETARLKQVETMAAAAEAAKANTEE